MAMPPYPTIVVPGITASYLLDGYPLPPETIWSVLTKEYERAALHPDDLRFEAAEPALVAAGQVFEIAYRELIEELRHNLRSKSDQPVPVFPFSYDWRQPLDMTERRLGGFVEEVIARTKLLRHYDRAGYADDPKVNLLGHSMGGLVIAGYLQRAGNSHRVAKVATLAAPFQGSFEAVIKVTTGTADLGESAPSSREREASRVTPALYHLLPSFANGVMVPPSLPRSLYDPGIWQPSIIDTIKEYIRLRGLSGTGRDDQARALFQGLLEVASGHRQRIDSLDLGEIGLVADDWLCVAGVNTKTRVRLTVEDTGKGPNFRFMTTDRDNRWGDQDPQQRRLTGDGTVPFEGAVPKFLSEANLICVTPDDYGYWEIQDRTVSAVAGFHGILPNMDMLHRLVVAHFTGRPDRHGNIWGRPAPGISKDDWRPAVSGLATPDD